jgi:serine/threonine-protein kinase HipA
MPFNATPLPGARQPFNGLHGVFNDSLPDGWGLLLMDRALQSRYGWHREQISLLDRLAYIGNRGMGALEYLPELQSTTTEHAVDVAALAAAAEVVTSGAVDEVIAELYLQGGSPGGARPKVTVARDRQTGACLSGFGRIPDNYEHWMVKFHGRGEPRDSGRVEMAYAEMAAAAGLHIPPTELLEVPVKQSSGRKAKQHFFAARRFDRRGNDKFHLISLAGYLHADHRLPSFDLTFSSGMGNEHTSAIAGKGNPNRDDALSLARSFGIRDASEVIDDVRRSVARWPLIAAKWDITASSADGITAGLRASNRQFFE